MIHYTFDEYENELEKMIVNLQFDIVSKKFVSQLLHHLRQAYRVAVNINKLIAKYDDTKKERE